MSSFEQQRQILLSNLAAHAAPARRRLCLSLADASRLAGLTPELLTAVERGAGCTLCLGSLQHLTAFLGLTGCGLPRPKPAGMQ
ncbi:hypothetical protein LOK46_24075 [Methylobacterium sp. NMS14P]|uniref:hypothetical protein n=1 Tax=unclassified Methylobacterium TaxID=2615210 RepID=UPI002358963A|nr:hypothetical protein [Methylobacterium sp. NMS14P]WCS24187.1 hypothetical protein LOK46_24075 [Methylobacterium sp. NMS14P]